MGTFKVPHMLMDLSTVIMVNCHCGMEEETLTDWRCRLLGHLNSLITGQDIIKFLDHFSSYWVSDVLIS